MALVIANVVQRKDHLVSKIERAQAHDPIRSPGDRDQCAAIDGDRQHITIVIVRMLADQIHTPWSLSDQLW